MEVQQLPEPPAFGYPSLQYLDRSLQAGYGRGIIDQAHIRTRIRLCTIETYLLNHQLNATIGLRGQNIDHRMAVSVQCNRCIWL
jgi:hypothetical protein